MREDPDAQFFTQHRDRKVHIRVPGKITVLDRQRAAHVVDECEAEFRSLGMHNRDRRRILATRVDHRGTWLPENRVLKIPVLLFADETVEDTDDVLLPFLFGIMLEQAAAQGVEI